MGSYIQQHAALPLKETSETILKRVDWYIVAQAKKLMTSHPSSPQQEVEDIEVDELIQRSRIKFWRALEKGGILYPYSYIRHIVYSESIDMKRQQQRMLSRFSYEREECYQIEDMSDPADEVIQLMESTSLLNKIVPIVVGLPPRQRLAMICFLQDQVDDLVQLVLAFKKYRIDIEGLHWPPEKAERQVLQASLSVARRTLAKKMGNDIAKTQRNK